MKSMCDSDLTILMPTQNRPKFVARALNFYSKEKLPFELKIIDSSDGARKADMRDIVKNSDLNIFFCDFEYEVGSNSFNKFSQTLSDVTSEYVLMVADDDFIFPDAMHKCVEFLNCNQSYTSASGRSYEFELDEASVAGDIRYIESYPQSSVEHNLAERRFNSHMKNWTTSAYSVQRTKNLKEIINLHRNFSDDIRMMEIHWYATNVIRGKVVKLDTPYMFRQRAIVKEWSVNDFAYWSEALTLSGKRELLINLLAKELMDSGSKSLSYYRRLCDAMLSKWIGERHRFKIKNCFDYSLSYYLNKLNKKLGINRKIKGDFEAILKIRLALRNLGKSINGKS
jgi:glycosyltransferase domain-containing protein